ncbi:OmpA family protein [Pararhodobacter sp. SW119]|uniref:OmpA family protein n=1 Tax=Pararhodobacter sp. SW119 TaxID=2780075 RepID=UPI001AE03597|nr:OmpA family protein [Pararhodobacter sp. SW119]
MTLKPFIASIAAVGLLAACETPQGEFSRTQTGALTGAAIGGLLGATSNSSNRLGATAVGAAAGAIGGGAIGGILDRQAAELRRDLGPGTDVRNTGQEIIVTMPQDILFATDSATLRPDLRADLAVISNNLQRNPESIIRVVGHTDSTGSLAYNLGLSERRADSVAAVLIQNGVSGRRIVTQGVGPNQPVASNATAAGRAQNRRVEIVIRPTI